MIKFDKIIDKNMKGKFLITGILNIYIICCLFLIVSCQKGEPTKYINSIIWTKININTWGLNSMFFTNEKYGFLCNEQGTLFRTTDGGVTWTSSYKEILKQSNSLFFLNPKYGVAVVRGQYSKIVLSNDSGKTWKIVANPLSDSTIALNAIQFIDSENGYIVGRGGVVLKTINAGKKWNVIRTPKIDKISDLNSVCFVNKTIGYAVGGNGTILKTINEGNTWIELTNRSTITANNLKSVHFIDEQNGYAVGDWGTIIKTTDGGKTWINNYTGITPFFNSVCFADKNIGYAVGDKIVYTTNGGQTWIDFPEFKYGVSVVFVNSSVGFILNSVSILKTTNAEVLNNK